MVKQDSGGSAWSQELVSFLKAAETMARAMSRLQLARQIRRLRTALTAQEDLSEEAFFALISGAGKREANEKPKDAGQESTRYAEISLDEAEDLIGNSETTKAALVALAGGRFGAATGSLTRLSKGSLVDELRAMIRNERGHASITRVVEGKANPVEDDKDPRGLGSAS